MAPVIPFPPYDIDRKKLVNFPNIPEFRIFRLLVCIISPQCLYPLIFFLGRASLGLPPRVSGHSLQFWPEIRPQLSSTFLRGIVKIQDGFFCSSNNRVK